MSTESVKIKVAEFLKNKSFLNSRVAHRAFTEAHPEAPVQQTYFYTLFTLFGKRATKKELALQIITSGTYKNCMEGYKEYTKKEEFTRAENPLKPVAFAYFLNLWKRHFNITGTVRVAITPKVKGTSKHVKTATEIVVISTMTAREILAKAAELLKGKAKELPTNVKNKTGIVKAATKLFINAGYQVK
jgi:hypothetical protein